MATVKNSTHHKLGRIDLEVVLACTIIGSSLVGGCIATGRLAYRQLFQQDPRIEPSAIKAVDPQPSQPNIQLKENLGIEPSVIDPQRNPITDSTVV